MVIEVKPLTVAGRLRAQAIISQMRPFIEELVKEYEMPSDKLWNSLYDYAAYCVRINGLPKKCDFQWAKGLDDAETIKTKFVAYLDTVNIDLVREIEAAINEIDQPIDPDLAPYVDVTDPNA